METAWKKMFQTTNYNILPSETGNTNRTPSSNEPLKLPPSFFYLTTKQSLIAIPFQREQINIMAGFSYIIEKEKDSEENYILVLKKFYPYPIIALNNSAIIYETTPINAVEYKFFNTVLGSRKSELTSMLAQLGYEYEEIESIIEGYKKRRITLEENAHDIKKRGGHS